MKTGEHYAKISWACLLVQVLILVGSWILPDRWDLLAILAIIPVSAVAIWAIIMEARAKKQVPAPEFTKEDTH